MNFTPATTGRGSPPYVNAPDAADTSALHRDAFEANYYAAAGELNAANNADVNRRAADGRTPLSMVAASRGNDSAPHDPAPGRQGRDDRRPRRRGDHAPDDRRQ